MKTRLKAKKQSVIRWNVWLRGPYGSMDLQTPTPVTLMEARAKAEELSKAGTQAVSMIEPEGWRPEV